MNHEFFKLVSEARLGKKEAFTQIVKRYKDPVFRQAYAILHDRMEAEDVSQEAFLKAYNSLARLNSQYAFSSWLTRIVCHLCYDRIQKKKREELAAGVDLEGRIPAIHDPQEMLERKQLQLTIQEAMGTLSPDHRTVIVLRDVQGFSYEEMANILEIPVGTVKSRIHAARMALRNELSR